ncbi:glucose-6-phosphate dehydrogenase assembly protein OpcA [Mycetocola zhujimingii]|uniref:OpcA protein n=1 Tax=Mycetocola zhujimingii TaxID=2079792 RepID=A0A2U1TGE8_9MICO|nr:glucose-6-phosphate dehydrogenase assembly protein OpcA [Mycetocola zhujimingii]AWB86388.1 OpcA protein [Mycetocola zhujimingii]PWC07936.1 OpcA protein [Mycetocola zhujimingii]
MIVDLPDTTTSKVSKKLVQLREDGGVVSLGRVLTLVIVSQLGEEEEAIEAANDASREHPMRVLVLSRIPSDDEGGAKPARIDAEIRVGGDAGASEVIILRAYGDAAGNEDSLINGLLLPDTPVVAWWPIEAPADVAHTAIGRIAQRRITDASEHEDPHAALVELARTHTPGDTDFAWTRLTLWRAQLAAVLDQPPYEPVTAVTVSGAADSPSTLLLAAWLGMQLQVPVVQELTPRGSGDTGIHGVRMTRESGDIVLERPLDNVAKLTQPNQPIHDLSLPRRSMRDCLAEELRRLDPDSLYGEVITKGLSQLESEALASEGTN